MTKSSEWINNIKHVIRVTLVGIDPSDQVQIKGYLRIILRVEFDIEWVSPKNPKVDLFLVNHAFSHSSSIKNLIEQSQSPVLYIAKNDEKNNIIENNTLYLRLDHVSILETWLHQNVPCIYGVSSAVRSTSEEIGMVSDDDTDQTLEEYTLNTSDQGNGASTSSSDSMFNENAVVLINMLGNTESDSYYEVIDSGVVVAIVKPRERLVWPKGDSFFPSFSFNWTLKEVFDPSLEVRNSMNMGTWVWICALKDKDIIKVLPLDAKLTLKTWPKPKNNTDKSDYLRILAMLELKALSVNDIVNKTTISLESVHRCMSALYMAGFLDTGLLDHDVYVKRQVKKATSVEMMNMSVKELMFSDEVIGVQSNDDVDQEINVVKEKKLGGFLSRIRSTLGF